MTKLSEQRYDPPPVVAGTDLVLLEAAVPDEGGVALAGVPGRQLGRLQQLAARRCGVG